MKKFFALLLCLVLLISLVACGSPEEETTEKTENTENVATESQNQSEDQENTEEAASEEAHDHTHINYKGQETVFAADALAQIEGRECDFTYEQNGNMIYIYNTVEVDGMSFKQVQFTFSEDHNRISCTYTVDKGTEEAPKAEEEIKAEVEKTLGDYEQALAAIYGEGARSEQHGYELVSWNDHSGNYIILTQINDTTVQVAYYIYAK